MLELDRNKYYRNDEHKRVNFTKNFNFGSYSPINVRRCGNIYYIFGHIHHVNLRNCQFFGHLPRFWSYSFGHLDSVKWITLKFLCRAFCVTNESLFENFSNCKSPVLKFENFFQIFWNINKLGLQVSSVVELLFCNWLIKVL